MTALTLLAPFVLAAFVWRLTTVDRSPAKPQKRKPFQIRIRPGAKIPSTASRAAR
jgi:hypothetical protein